MNVLLYVFTFSRLKILMQLRFFLTILMSVVCSAYKSFISISKVRSLFLANVGVSKVAFSPFINFTSRNSRNICGSSNTGGHGKLGPNRGTASSEKIDSRYLLLEVRLTTANISWDVLRNQ